MTIFLEEFSKQFTDYMVIMVIDNASWHGDSITKKIENIVPLFQPPYSPELNPAEHIWHYIRESGLLKNRTFQPMNDVEEQLIIAVNALLSDKDKIKSITGFHWIKASLQDYLLSVLY
jgi:transposase